MNREVKGYIQLYQMISELPAEVGRDYVYAQYSRLHEIVVHERDSDIYQNLGKLPLFFSLKSSTNKVAQLNKLACLLEDRIDEFGF